MSVNLWSIYWLWVSKKSVVYLLAMDVFGSVVHQSAVDVCESVVYLLAVDF
jgi:hypothetical protein